MNIKNAKNWSSVPRPIAYLAALGLTMTAFSLRHLLQPYIAPYAPYQLFVIASLASEYLLGLGPALLSALLGLLLATHFFVAPFGVMDGVSKSDVIFVVNYIVGTLFAIALIEYLRRALYENQLLLKVSRSRHKISLHRENDRLYLAKRRAASALTLQHLFARFDEVLLLDLPGTGLFPQALLGSLRGGEASVGADALTCFAPDDMLRLLDALKAAESGGAARELRLRLAGTEAQAREVSVSVEGMPLDGMRAAVVRLVRTHDEAHMA
ncbi:DUF4118 domain-containing protein [Noviherbaspirillum pedocola]|uniref:DUF4118 domain-containing protein n=1 Tax=Noviherbaspirillum pedocola TaxID=2801341 RepID=A0A934SWW9_9BURK|nr:DUF4118 domain-containing protein [Noviherbaspirillum pedocola]MBK4734342.1 DUF4118 domain-containing protein [Noviherbaspirillum pedocola]